MLSPLRFPTRWSIKAFAEISEGVNPELPEPLKQIIWVSLRLKKQHSTSEDGQESKLAIAYNNLPQWMQGIGDRLHPEF